MEHDFNHRLTQGPILAAGAMGTELHRRHNLSMGVCFEQLNLTDPDLVRGVQVDYLEAGAELIETNTYGANWVRLERHGLADVVQEINRRAVELAREAQSLTGQRIWVAGAVGPLGKPVAPLWPQYQAEAQAAFREQIQALVEAGVDLLILETFPSLAEIQEAITAARSVGDVPIVAQLTFTQEGLTPAGDTPEEVAAALMRLGLAAIGANCSVGSEPMLRVIEEMAPRSDTHLSALPNAGFPAYVDGRFVYLSSPSYMAEYADRMLDSGATIIGGCCGTTPEHIAAMREALSQPRSKRTAGGPQARAEAAPTSQLEHQPSGVVLPQSQSVRGGHGAAPLL